MTADIAAAALIVNYHAYDDLARCLTALARFEPGMEVIVVDHASDAARAAALAERFPGVTLIARSDNRGFACGINMGARQTRASRLLVINPDAVLDGPVLPELERVMAPGVAVVGPLVRDADGSIQASARRFPDLSTVLGGRSTWLTRAMPGNRLTRRNLLTGPDVRTPMAVDWVSGACMLVRRDAFDAVGGFDEGYFLYWEDADFCRRLRDAGWRTVYNPGASVHHTAGRSSRHRPVAAERAFHDSVLRYFRRHTPAPARWAAPLVWLALQARLALRLLGPKAE